MGLTTASCRVFHSTAPRGSLLNALAKESDHG
jgi:hypothetical protein